MNAVYLAREASLINIKTIAQFNYSGSEIILSRNARIRGSNLLILQGCGQFCSSCETTSGLAMSATGLENSLLSVRSACFLPQQHAGLLTDSL